MSTSEQARPIDLDATEFGTRLVSPNGARFELTDAGVDARGPFVWLVPIGEDGCRTGQRRAKLRQADAPGWVVDRQEDEAENSAAVQAPVAGTKPRSFPLPRPAQDPRFTFGLAYDVGKVIEAAGFPKVSGSDLVELQMALFRFLYADETARAGVPGQTGIVQGGADPRPAALAAPPMYARPNEDGRCVICDGTKRVCQVCHEPHSSTAFLDHETVMLPCRECNGGSYPVRPAAEARPTHTPQRLNADIVVCVHCTQAEGVHILWPCLAFSAADIAADFAATPALDDVHAMMPDRTGGSPRCGAVGRVALFAYNVTCPRCLAMLAELLRDDEDPTSGPYVACEATCAGARVHTRESVVRTTEDAPDVYADRDHVIRITVWDACTDRSGGTR